jgi:hypothetical protein
MLRLLFLYIHLQDIEMFEFGHFECYKRLFEMLQGTIRDVGWVIRFRVIFSSPVMLHLLFADVASWICECCTEIFCLLF